MSEHRTTEKNRIKAETKSRLRSREEAWLKKGPPCLIPTIIKLCFGEVCGAGAVFVGEGQFD